MGGEVDIGCAEVCLVLLAGPIVAFAKFVNPLIADIEANGGHAIAKGDRYRQPHVTKPDHRNFSSVIH